MEYQYIVNPQTNRKCRIDTALGRRIIKNYAKISQRGGKFGADCPILDKKLCGFFGCGDNEERYETGCDYCKNWQVGPVGNKRGLSQADCEERFLRRNKL